MTQVTITDFRKNLKKYSILAQKEDLEIVNRKEVVFIVKGPRSSKMDAFNALMGAARSDVPYEEILKERIKEL
ncbi:MAG: hypothetical protein IJJ00_04470 [Erysipelotrichaceae bacterium]|nr:hypothetical protein [Erysipelotrichaceae bacterium]